MSPVPAPERRAARLRQSLDVSPSAYAYVGVAAALATIPAIVVPLLVRAFVDQYLIAGDTSWAAPIAIGMITALLVVAALRWLQGTVLTRLCVQLSATGSTRFTWHLLRLPVPTLDEFGPGDLSARAGAMQRHAFLAGLLVPMALARAVTIVVLSVVVIALDVVLGIAGLVVVVSSIVLSVLLLRRRRTLQSRADATLVALSATTTQVVASIETIKAAGWEPWIFDRWSQRRSAAAQATSELANDGQRLGLMPSLTQTIGLGLILALGSLLVLAGNLSLGTLAASQTLLLAILIPAGQLVWLGSLIESMTSIERQSAEVTVHALDPEIVAAASRHEPLDGPVAVALRAVTFGYEPVGSPLFQGLSLAAAAGSWLAVVGSSGSGKSTLARLVVGELQPWSGSVLLDGVPRLELSRQARALRVGYVPQYPVLMPGTLADNITMFDPTLAEEEILQALADACVLDAVSARPGGLQELVSATGHGFSGGELQRLAIARALVRNPGLLVLDEATSALDPLTEERVGRALRERGCTCLVVAHRLSTVRDADHIVVLEHGEAVQSGTFEDLRHAGRFAELAHG